MDYKVEEIKKEDKVPVDESGGNNLKNEVETINIIKEEDVVVKVEVKDITVTDSGDNSLIGGGGEYESLASFQFSQTETIEDDKNELKPQKRRGHYRKCPFCEKHFNDTSKLKYHIYTHTGEKPFVCEVCQQSFSHPRPLKRHMLLHNEKTIACPHCPKSFSDNKLLDLHLKYIGQSFTCSICGNVYARKENLKAHERKHTGETPYSCNYCEEKFNMSYKLKDHMNSKHLNIERKLFVCEFCGKEYKKRSDMNEHTNTHTGDPTSKCELCQETFNTKTAHREHMNIHNKKHECKDCGKCFGNARNLERHEKAHSGIKDFQCSICAKPYTSLRSLQKHMEIKHDVTQGKKQTFSCEICDRSYTRADYLERHMSKH
eukprot:TRINITY_DN47467_c0_g1_i1.p1 TRINITY_DN47467_c0_g1~~TRINITY_DN47467_c0_g1_i1.p1  ORF type:complete len:374 (-),score=64.85 TRINITY_DN47467_c0_g1_i1:40-1161(-)